MWSAQCKYKLPAWSFVQYFYHVGLIGRQYERAIAFHSWAKITWFYQSLNLSLHPNFIALGRSQNTLTHLGLDKSFHFEDIICCCNLMLETIILRQIALISNNTFVWWPSDCFSKALMHVCSHDWMQNLQTGVAIFHYVVSWYEHLSYRQVSNIRRTLVGN